MSECRISCGCLLREGKELEGGLWVGGYLGGYVLWVIGGWLELRVCVALGVEGCLDWVVWRYVMLRVISKV